MGGGGGRRVDEYDRRCELWGAAVQFEVKSGTKNEDKCTVGTNVDAGL